MDSIKNNIENKVNISPSLLNLLDLIFKSCPDGIVYKDNKLRYKAMNNAFCNFFKINNSEDYIGSDCLSFLSDENKTKISDYKKAYVENQEMVKIEVYEGEKPLVKDNHLLGSFFIKDIPTISAKILLNLDKKIVETNYLDVPVW